MKSKRVVQGVLLSLIFLVFFTYMIAGFYGIFLDSSAHPEKEMALASVSQVFQEKLDLEQELPKLELDAKSAILVETNLSDEKIIFEKNSQDILPIASLTKLMTAVVVLDNYQLLDFILIDELANAQIALKQDVELGDTMTVENLLKLMLVGSSNKSAYALAQGPDMRMGIENFVKLMNDKAKELGMGKTFFVDPTGLSSKNVSTVSDLVKLAKYILKYYPKITEVSSLRAVYIPGIEVVSNTDELLNEIPEAICSKTGFTNAAMGCLLLAINNPNNEKYFINIILGAENRFEEMKKIINWSCQSCY